MSRFRFHFWADALLSEPEFFPDGIPSDVTDDSILNELEDYTPIELLVEWGMTRDLHVSVEDTLTGSIYDEERGQWVKR